MFNLDFFMSEQAHFANVIRQFRRVCEKFIWFLFRTYQAIMRSNGGLFSE